MFGGWCGDAGGVSSEDAPKVVSMMHRQLRELPSAAEGFSRVVEVQSDAQHAAVVRTLTALPAADALTSGCPTPYQAQGSQLPHARTTVRSPRKLDRCLTLRHPMNITF